LQLGIFVLVLVILAGAWFGYWGVRKLVLTEDGSVDEGVAYFVEWSILIVSAVMILQVFLAYCRFNIVLVCLSVYCHANSSLICFCRVLWTIFLPLQLWSFVLSSKELQELRERQNFYAICHGMVNST
jgi:hypothetical protein